MNFLKKLPSGTITADDVQSFGPDAYLHSGMYTFMTGPDDDRRPVEARFSYMWRKVDGDWKIVHHHSSAVPKIPGAEEAVESVNMYPVAQASQFEFWLVVHHGALTQLYSHRLLFFWEIDWD